VLRCNGVNVPAAGATTRFYGNGGTFRPLCLTTAGQTMAANAFSYLYASTNGLVVDTSETLDGAAYTIAQPVLHDPALDVAADGGLVKRGLGTLTLTGANTYTGGTVVEGGVLALSGTGTLGTGSSLSVAGGAICDLGGTAHAVADLTASGLVRNGALTVTNGLLVGEDVLSVDGDLELASTVTVDFAGRSDLDLRGGEPVAFVTGTATLPNNARAANAGEVRAVVFARDGNTVYAVAAPTGTVILFR
jgi:autotransporter-associated beta strand protein